MNPAPGYIAKSKVRGAPLIGFLADKILGSLFLERTSKDSRSEVFDKLQEKAKLAGAGKATPLSIFAEGGTTNGSGIMHMKKGAFSQLVPIKPWTIKYWNLRAKLQ